MSWRVALLGIVAAVLWPLTATTQTEGGRRVPLDRLEELPLAAPVAGVPDGDPATWARDGDLVRFQEVFPGVDLVYAHGSRRIEAVLVAGPGAELRDVRLGGAADPGARLAAGAEPVLYSAGAPLRVQEPEGWQQGPRRLTATPVQLVRRAGGRIGIEAPEWDGERALVVRVFLAASAGPMITASATDTLSTDGDTDAEADPGDVITYEVTIANTGDMDATGVTLDFTEDANTTGALVNITPIAEDQGVSTNEDTALPITLTGIDFDAGETATLTYTLMDLPPPAEGEVTGTPPSVTFEPAADFAGETSFTFRVTDTKGDASNELGTVTVTVTDVNDAPSITSAANVDAPENQTAVIDLEATDVEGDTEGGGGLTYAITGGADQAFFSIVLDTGVLTFDDAPDFDAPADADADNVYEVQVTVTDSGAETDVQNLQVTVIDANDPPSITSSATPSAAENQTTAVDVQSTDPDGETEGGGGLTYAITGGTDQADFSIDANTGVMTFDAAPDFENPTDANTDGVYDVQVTVTDAGAQSGLQDIAVTVTDANEAPSITSSATASVGENQTGALDVDSTDPDGETEGGGGLTYTITGGADQADFSIDANTGVLTFNAAPDFEGPGDADMNNVYEVQVTVTDAGTLSGLQDIAITVLDGSDPPTIATDPIAYTTVGNVQLRAGTPATTAVAYVEDAQDIPTKAGVVDPEGSPVSYSLDTGPSNGSATVNSNGTFLYTPNAGFVGADSFTYEASDGMLTATGTVNVTVTDTDGAAPGDQVAWFVENNAAAGGLGRSTDPFDTLFEAQVASGVGDTIFVLEGDGLTTGQNAGIALKNNQNLLGHAATSLVLNGITVQTPNPGAKPEIGNSGGAGVTATNTAGSLEIRDLQVSGSTIGIDIDVDGAATWAITGNTIGGGSSHGLDVVAATAGAALGVEIANNTLQAANAGASALRVVRSGGTLAVTGFTGNTVHGDSVGTGVLMQEVTFDADTSLGGTQPVAGTLAVGASGNAITGAGVSLMTVRGGLTLTDLDVFNGGGTGFKVDNATLTAADLTLTIDPGAVIETTGGTALDLDPLTADVEFGQVSSSNGVNGVALTDVAGTVVINDTGGGSSITGATGASFLISGGTVEVTYEGDIIHGAAGQAMVSVSGGHQTGTVTFATGTLNATQGTGLQFNNADGTYELAGTTTLNGGDAGVDIVNGSGGTFTFASNTSITSPSGTAFSVNGGAPSVDYNGTITQANAVAAVVVAGTTGGTRSFDGAINADTTTATAINVSGAGTTSFTGGLDIDTTTGIGFQATGGTINVTGANTVNVGTGAQHAVDLSNVTIGGSGITFASIAATGATSSELVDIDSVAGGTFNGGAVTSPGTGAGAAIDITGSSAAFNFTSATIDATTGAGINLSGANGAVTFTTVDIDNTGNAGVVVASNTNAVSINGGTIGATNDPTGIGVDINGGSGNVTVAASVSKSSAGDVVEVTGRSGGAVTVSGNLGCTSGCTGIDVNNNTAGSTTFSGGTKTLNTGTTTAVSLATNTGHAINFTGGGLDIDTTSGTGFSATGGGSVNVTGAGNSILTTTGTALNIANTNIGANDLEFRSISADGASSGIVLNSTGSSGGLTVTGTGSVGSGGTIQNATGDGIALTSTRDVSLEYMIVSSSAEDGIDGVSVTGLSIANSLITNNGNAANEEGISLSNVAGAVVLTNVTANGNAYNNLRIDNTVGTVSSLSISGGSYSNNQAGVGNHGILIEPRGTSQITTATISGATISGNEVMGLQVATADVAVVAGFTVTGNTIQNNELGIDFSKAQTSSMTFAILNNVGMTGQNSHGINLFTAVGAGTTGNFRGRIEDNTIGNAAVDGSGSAIGNCIRVNINGDTNADILIDGNTLRECPVGRGIEVIGRNGTGGLDVTVTSNDVDHTNLAFNPGASDFPLAAILVQSNCATVCNTVRADVRGNTVPGGTSFDFLPTYIALVESNASTLELVDSAPASASCTAQLTSTNTGSASASAGCALIAGPIDIPPP